MTIIEIYPDALHIRPIGLKEQKSRNNRVSIVLI